MENMNLPKIEQIFSSATHYEKKKQKQSTKTMNLEHSILKAENFGIFKVFAEIQKSHQLSAQSHLLHITHPARVEIFDGQQGIIIYKK